MSIQRGSQRQETSHLCRLLADKSHDVQLLVSSVWFWLFLEQQVIKVKETNLIPDPHPTRTRVTSLASVTPGCVSVASWNDLRARPNVTDCKLGQTVTLPNENTSRFHSLLSWGPTAPS